MSLFRHFVDRHRRINAVLRRREERLYRKLLAKRRNGWAVWDGERDAVKVEAVEWADVIEVLRRRNGT